jgi:hypothetical protein
MPDQLSAHYRDVLAGSYDCVDRIVLNAYFRLGMNPGGFRYRWQPLTGSEEELENEHWIRMAGASAVASAPMPRPTKFP